MNQDWFDAGCPCGHCGTEGAEERYSFGVYAGRLCRECAIHDFTDHCGIGCSQGTQADLDEPIEAEAV